MSHQTLLDLKISKSPQRVMKKECALIYKPSAGEIGTKLSLQLRDGMAVLLVIAPIVEMKIELGLSSLSRSRPRKTMTLTFCFGRTVIRLVR